MEHRKVSLKQQAIELALYQPLIPQNTGNIGRLCVGFNLKLNLIKPLGFELSDKQARRAGLDYWPHLDYELFDDFKSFFENKQPRRIVCLSKHGDESLPSFQFKRDDVLLMGNEVRGVDAAITERYKLVRVAIPMPGRIRSYNLANASAIAVYESTRQVGLQG